MTQNADVVVIGLGPGGGEVAAGLLDAGLDVVGVERELVGGECPYWGCIPSKMMIRAADLLAEGRRITGMAGTSEVFPDWAPVARRIPEDVAVVGFDDFDISRYTDPPLTTVRQPIMELGRELARQLLRVIAGEEVQPAVILPTELVVRASA